KIARGTTPHAVARQGLLKPRDPDTVYGWLQVYETQGVAGLLAHQHGGAHRRALRGARSHARGIAWGSAGWAGGGRPPGSGGGGGAGAARPPPPGWAAGG